MNCFWLINNCFSFFCFRLSLLFAFIFSLSFLYISFVVVWFLICFLLYTLSSSRNISPYFCSVSSFFLVFYVYCSHDAVCFFLCIFQYSLF